MRRMGRLLLLALFLAGQLPACSPVHRAKGSGACHDRPRCAGRCKNFECRCRGKRCCICVARC